MKSLAKNSLYNIIYQALSLIFPLITSIYVSRIIMEDGVGKVAYAQNIVSYFVSIATLGFPAYGIREIAKVSKNRKDRSHAFSEMFTINAVATTLAVSMYLVMISCVTAYRNSLTLYMCAGLVIALNYANIDWLYQGQEEYGYITVRSLVVKIISLIGLICFVKQKDDYVIYALITSLGIACNYLFNLLHARKFVDFSFRHLELKRHLQPLCVLTVTAFLGGIYNKIDVTMLGIMSTNSVVGYYSNSHKIILLVVSCCMAVSAVFMPRLSYYYSNDKAALEKLVSFGTQILISIVLPATIGLMILAQDAIVLLYGENFLPAGETLAIFAPMLLIRPIGDLLCYQLLISIGQEKKRLYSSLIAAIVNITLNAVLIPVWQQNGAAVASVVSEAVINGILLIYVLKEVKIEIKKSFIMKTLAATFLMAGSIVFVRYVINFPIYSLVGSVTVGAMVYYLSSYLLKNETIIVLFKKLFMIFKRNN